MKKILSIVLCAAAVSAFGETVAELGQVGVTAITSSLSNTIVAVSYDDLADGSGMVVSNFVKTANLDEGDQLAVFNGGEYTTWTLTIGEGSAKYWAKDDKTFKINAEGEQIEGTGPQASDITQAVGTGIWLIRKKMPTEPFKFYIYGKPSTTKTIKTVPGAWNLVGNPTQDDVTITNGIVQAANNDTILVPESMGLVTYIYKKNATDCNGDKGAWCRAAGKDGLLGPAPTIDGGKGFWIMTAEAVDIKW